MPAHDFLEELRADRPGATKPSSSAKAGEGPVMRSGEATTASTVLGLQRSVGNAGTSLFLQREQEADQGADYPQTSPVHETISGGGSPLDSQTRSSMEQSLGADFSSVRLHKDAKSAESVQAAAYTVGENIVVHPNHFAEGTPQAQRTLAHELTHVKQQRSGPVAGTERPGGIQVSDPSDRFEQEAETTAASVVPDEGHV